jgi:pentatricopeptide repeat protein
MAIQCWKFFTKMKMVGRGPHSYVVSSVLKACSSIGALEEGLNTHQEIRVSGIRVVHVKWSSSLVDMYVKCGDVEAALGAFEDITSKDVVS